MAVPVPNITIAVNVITNQSSIGWVSYYPFLLNVSFKYTRDLVVCVREKVFVISLAEWAGGTQSHTAGSLPEGVTIFWPSLPKTPNLPTANKLCFVFFVWNSKGSFYTPTPQRQTALLQNYFANNPLLDRSIQDEEEESHREAVVANGFSW